jgi:hypothetical protein
MIRRTLLTCLIGLALLAGPPAAACASCCPEIQERATIVTAGCCDCGQTLERAAAPEASLSGGTAAPEAAVVVTLISCMPRVDVSSLCPRLVGGLAFSPPSPPAPRRL